MSTKLLVVLGATGLQGGSVINAYKNDPNYRIRAVTRNPSSPSAQALIDDGVEAVAADFNDVKSLTAAFHGANIIFGVTDFIAAFKDPATVKNLKEGETLGKKCYDLELSHGMNIIQAILPIVNTTLERFIFSTLSAANKTSKGKYTYVYHFDSKAAITEQIKQHKELASITTYLQMGFYASNWSSNPLMCPKLGTNDVWELTTPCNPQTLHPIICASEDCGKLVRVLERAEPGTVLLGYSEMMSFSQWMDAWGRVNDVQVKTRGVSWKDWDAAIPGGIGREVAETKCYSEEFGFDGGEKGVKRPEDFNITGLTKVEDYLRSVNWSERFALSSLSPQFHGSRPNLP